MALTHIRLGTLPGIRRPAIAVLLPTPQGKQVLIDGGANADCQPARLVQFGLMGSTYAQYALQIDQPRVGLLSIGQEPSKGNKLTQDSYELLSRASINFVGNVEGDDILSDKVDVIVAYGFAGNIALKTIEGTVQFAVSGLENQISQSWLARLGAVMMRPALAALKDRLDYATYGGALLLGVEGICVVSHGRSDAKAIANAIYVAYQAAQGHVVERIRDACSKLMPAAVG